MMKFELERGEYSQKLNISVGTTELPSPEDMQDLATAAKKIAEIWNKYTQFVEKTS